MSLGLRDLGYEYVVLDDCWQDARGRDKHGRLQPSLAKFPNGLNSIADHLHSQNLKFGMYSSAGEMTCARFGRLLEFLKAECHANIEKKVLWTMRLRMLRASQDGA